MNAPRIFGKAIAKVLAVGGLAALPVFSCFSTNHEPSRTEPYTIDGDFSVIPDASEVDVSADPVCPQAAPTAGGTCPEYIDIVRCDFPGPNCVVGGTTWAVTVQYCCFREKWSVCARTPTPCDKLEAGVNDASDAGDDGGVMDANPDAAD